MRSPGALRLVVASSCLAALLAAACGKSDGSNVNGSASGNGNNGTGNASARAGTTGGPDIDIDIGGASNGSDGAGGDGLGDECAGDLIEAQRVPLDMYVMLDVSGSMLAPTEGDLKVTKWQAVSSALSEFVKDDASSGIGMGLQVFPIRDPAAPASCTTSAECGDFGPCFRKLCDGYLDVRVCDKKADCGFFGGNCINFGFCEGDPNIVCVPVGDACEGENEQGEPLGDCVQPPTSPCLTTADCRPATYAMPAPAIAQLPAARDALVSAIEATMPDPDGATPTGPALSGAIDQASSWAVAHADHQVVAVLATDGLPTECTPVAIDEVAAIAGNGFQATPSIQTFVIGVFGAEDLDAPGNLNAIAQAGGTTQAFLVDTQGDVAMQFRDALNQIRASGLSCDLLVPQAEAGKTVDYDKVNVVFDDGAGSSTLGYVGSAAACEAEKQGWYFDKNPDEGETPERILVCPDTCTNFRQVDMGSVQIKLGCERRDVVK
jgi:hypothetical protein